MATNKGTNRNWVDALNEIQGTRENQPKGEGWKTTTQLKEIYKCGTCRMYDILNKGMADGKVEQFQGTEKNSSGRMVRRVWYKIK